METFSDGTRNTYGIAITPTLDPLRSVTTPTTGVVGTCACITLSGLEDHGYPRLYMNFADETVAPLAGLRWAAQALVPSTSASPVFPPAWNHRPYTCDWGRQGSLPSHPRAQWRYLQGNRQAGDPDQNVPPYRC